MLRCVLDTDVIIAAMRSPTGASSAILQIAADTSQVCLLASVPLALEYEAKCLETRHWTEAQLSKEEASIFVDAVITLVEPVHMDFLWRPQLHDPADEMVLETAINGRADILVTFNLRDYGDAPARFGIQAMRPADAIRRIRI
jgi:putative PIN family toxin of toxin-antitoxin system